MFKKKEVKKEDKKEKVEVNPNDFPDQGEYLKAKKEAEEK